MPEYKVQTNQRVYKVTIESKSRREYEAEINGATIKCVCDRVEELSTWTITRESAKVHAKLRISGPDKIEMWIGGLPFQFFVTPVGFGRMEQTKPTLLTERGEIRSVMPGRITSILVKPGDEVAIGTPLLILEAMKMQNEIVSHKSGQVASIKVREGATVRKDDVLLEVR